MMFQVLKHVISLLVLCVMLKQSLLSFLLFGLGYINIWKINMAMFSIHWIVLLVLSYVSGFLPSTYFFLIHRPYLEHLNSVEAGS